MISWIEADGNLLVNVLMSRHHIAQLVGASELNPAAVNLVQVVEVIRLEHLVGELGQTHTVCALQPGLHAVAAQHGPHPEMPPSLRQKVHHAALFIPAQVVKDSNGSQRLAAVVKKHFMVGKNPQNALPDAVSVGLHYLGGQPFPLARLSARVPNLSRRSSEHRDDIMPGASEVLKADKCEQVAYMETVGCGVKAAVNSLRARLEQPGKLVLCCLFWERVLQNTAFVQRQQEAAVCGRRAVIFRVQCEMKTSSFEETTGHMPPNTTEHHGYRHVEQCDQPGGEAEERLGCLK